MESEIQKLRVFTYVYNVFKNQSNKNKKKNSKDTFKNKISQGTQFLVTD